MTTPDEVEALLEVARRALAAGDVVAARASLNEACRLGSEEARSTLDRNVPLAPHTTELLVEAARGWPRQELISAFRVSSDRDDCRVLRAIGAILTNQSAGPEVRSGALSLLGTSDLRGALPLIRDAQRDPDPLVRRTAYMVLTTMLRADDDIALLALQVTREGCSDPAESVRRAAITSVGAAIFALCEALLRDRATDTSGVRKEAARVLLGTCGYLGASTPFRRRLLELVRSALSDPEPLVRREAIGALSGHGDPDAADLVRELAGKDSDPEVRRDADFFFGTRRESPQ